MGYMTVVSILNDAWDTIKEHKEQFIENIEQGMHEYHTGKKVNSYPVSNYANPMEVHQSFHANMNKVLVVGGNHMEDIVELQPSRIDSDFYLAYKLRMANVARAMANSASNEIIEAFARTTAQGIKTLGLGIDNIREYVEKTETFNTMDEKEQATAILLIGTILNEE